MAGKGQGRRCTTAACHLPHAVPPASACTTGPEASATATLGSKAGSAPSSGNTLLGVAALAQAALPLPCPLPLPVAEADIPALPVMPSAESPATIDSRLAIESSTGVRVRVD